MKRLFTFLLITISLGSLNAQVAISDTGSSANPHPSAVLDVQSLDKGVLFPRISQAQRDSISNPAQSLLIYNLTTNCLQIYMTQEGWSDIYCDCANPPSPSFSIPNPIGQYQAVSFSADSPSLNYSWSFQNGTPSNSSAQNPSVSWANPGTYNVSLTVTDNLGCTAAQSAVVTVNPCTPPSAAFTVNPSVPSPNNAATFTPTYQGTGSYSWTFPNGSPSSSTAQNPSVTWNTPDTVSVSLSVTDSIGCSNSSSQSVFIPNCAPLGNNTVTFNNSSTGRFGSVQTWTVPAGICTIEIEAWGAKGGGSRGGNGAYVKGEFSVTPGETISMIVGQMGGLTNQGSNYVGGGGGGTFVYRNVNDSFPLLAAAGGGGQSEHANGGSGSGTATTTSGSGGSGTASGGTNGNGGSGGLDVSSLSSGSGGAGWLTNGNTGVQKRAPIANTQGIAPRNGGQGGIFGHANYVNADGGYGGGAGGVDNSGAGGGGGGWNGGGGANNYTGQWGAGGGGGSYNGGTNQTNLTGVRNTHGQVIITY